MRAHWAAAEILADRRAFVLDEDRRLAFDQALSRRTEIPRPRPARTAASPTVLDRTDDSCP
jgi:hypothetical protein